MNTDRRITIQRASYTRDEFNEKIADWGTLATVWAKADEIPDGERWRAGEMSADISTRFTIRYNAVTSSVTPMDRIVFKGRFYDINRIKEIQRNAWLEITAAARGDQSTD